MGAWGHGPFDNDCAADFAHDVRQCTSPPARTALLLDTMRQVLTGEVGILPEEPPYYRLDARMEHAVAAVAFTADACAGRSHHTANPFARGLQNNDELFPPVVLEPVTAELHATALALLDWIGQHLVTDDVGMAFAQELNLLRADLSRYQPAATRAGQQSSAMSPATAGRHRGAQPTYGKDRMSTTTQTRPGSDALGPLMTQREARDDFFR